MINHCIFLKKCQCLNCNSFYSICPGVKCLKIGCSLSLFEKKNRTENVKMFLQNNSINNDVTNVLK